MTRKQTLEAIKIAGSKGDQQTLVRLYTENRIGYMAALTAYAEGARIARNLGGQK